MAKQFTDCPDFEWIMIDASHIRVHQHGMGAPGGTEDAGRTRGGINTKLHVAVDSHGMPIRFSLTAGNQADCTQGILLLNGFPLQHVLDDKGTTQMPLLSICAVIMQPLSYLPKATVKFKEIMTNISISYVTWWKTIFKKLKDGAALQLSM